MQVVKNIPVAFCREALQRHLHNELWLFIHLKNNSSGIFNHCHLDSMFISSGIKTRSTFDKRINKLLELKWLRYDPKKQNYYPISIQRKGKKLVEINPDVKKENFQCFLYAAVHIHAVKGIRYYFSKTQQGIDKASISDLAFHYYDLQGRRKRWYGIGMKRMGSMLGMSRQRVNKLKLQADRSRFIECFERKILLRKVSRVDCLGKEFIENWQIPGPDNMGYNRDFKGFVKFIDGKSGEMYAWGMLPDEVWSNLRIKRKFIGKRPNVKMVA